MTYTFCTMCKTIKPDGEFLAVRKPYTCVACNTEPLLQGRVCPACEEFRHLKLFRYPLTLAQAEARGYFNHEVRPMHAYSKFCSYCRQHAPRGKCDMLKGSTRHYTTADLPTMPRRKLLLERERGRFSEAAVQMELDRRDSIRKEQRREAGKLGGVRRWETHDDNRWRWVADEVRKEIQRRATKMPGLRHAAESEDDVAVSKFEFYEVYMRALKEARDRAVVGLGDAKDGEYKWVDLIGEPLMDVLARLWAKIDHMARAPEDTQKKYARPGRPALLPLLIERRDKDLFDGCPVQHRKERTMLPKKSKTFKHYVHKVHVDNSWDS